MGQKRSQKKDQKAVSTYFIRASQRNATTPGAILDSPRGDEQPQQHSSTVAMPDTQKEILPATATQIHDMLHEVKCALQKDIKQMSEDLRKDIHEIGERTAHLEEQMSEFVEAHNDLADSHTKVQAEADRLADKVADLEDRSRRNNLRFRGIPEEVNPQELEQYILQLIAAIMPNTHPLEREMDRIHRVPKPRAAPEAAPRDVLARFVFFKTKEKLLSHSRKKEGWPPEYQKLEVYTDLSPTTLLKRKAFAETTALLRQHNIPYRWGYPVKLIVHRNGVPTTLTTADDARKAMLRWNILTAERDENSPTQQNSPSTLRKLRKDWHKT